MQNLYRTFIRTYDLILDFVIPRYCVGCGKERDALCGTCTNNAYQKWANCLLCGARNMTGDFCKGSCRKQTPTALKKVYWVGKYDGALKKAISQLKYKKRQELALPLGRLVARKFLQYAENFDPNNYVIVPIPLHQSRQHERGFNQAELIAHVFANQTGIRLQTKFLQKVKNTGAQAKIANRKERMENLENAFVANDGSPTSIKSIVILIDDVSTTGATLFHASKALAAVGVKNIIGVVVAHG